uniref:ribonuclease P n=1 Tax=Mesocestoides corti TaxID=53468 RepID=A0A5K3F8F1_MESCO
LRPGGPTCLRPDPTSHTTPNHNTTHYPKPYAIEMRLARSFVLLSKCGTVRRLINVPFVRNMEFDAKNAVSSLQCFDSYVRCLDNTFLENSRLSAVSDLLEDPSTDQHLKQIFWSKFVSAALTFDKNNLVDSLILYILEKPHSHSTVTLISVLKALGSKRRFDEFRSLYELIKSRLSPSDIVVYAADMSLALALTPFYKDARVLLDMTFERNLPIKQFSCLLTAAATYGPLHEAISLVDELHPMMLKPIDSFYSVFIERLYGVEEGKELMNQLLKVIQKCQYPISKSTALLIKEWFESYGWRGTLGVTFSGLSCASCLKPVRKLSFSSQDCCRLAELFYEHALKGKTEDELFLTTTNKELESFHSFINSRSRSFDCVVDLPNFLHTVSNRKLNTISIEEQTDMLSDLIHSLHRTYLVNRVCLVGKQRGVVGKKHFWDSIKALGNKTGVSVHTFLTEPKSNDDVFMIYLALWSGPHCYLLSNDEFRQHRFTVGPELGKLLSQWQASRHIRLRNNHPTSFLGPVLCDTSIQGSMISGWHIPYESGEQRPSYLPPNTWLCLQPPKP